MAAAVTAKAVTAGKAATEVTAATAGAVVENLPEGGEEVKIGDVTYVKIGEVYYQPIQKDGKNMYEVVNVEKVDSSKK